MNNKLNSLALGAITIVGTAVACTAGSEDPTIYMAPVNTGETNTNGVGTGGSGTTTSTTMTTNTGIDNMSGAGGEGTGGTGSDVGGGGAGGSEDVGPPAPVFNGGETYRWWVKCAYTGNRDPWGDDFSCANKGDICWVTPGGERIIMDSDQSAGTYGSPGVQLPITGGEPGKTYRFRIRIRGVMEPKDYGADQCPALFNRAQTPANEQGQITVCRGDGDEAKTTFDTFRITVPELNEKYYLNQEPVAAGHRVNTIDDYFLMDVVAGTTLEFLWDDRNGGLIANCPGLIPESLVGDPEAPFDGQPYNGNWFQLEAEEWCDVGEDAKCLCDTLRPDSQGREPKCN